MPQPAAGHYSCSVFWLFKALKKRCLKWVRQNTREVQAPATGYLVLSSVRCGKNTLFFWRATKTDALVAVKHPVRASEKTLEKVQSSEQGWRETLERKQKTKPKVASPWRAFFTPFIKCGLTSTAKSQSGPSLQCNSALADTWHKNLQPKPRRFGKFLAKLNPSSIIGSNHVNSAIADTTHSAYNSAISADKPPASSCPHGDSLRRPQERTALLCSGESVKFIICLLFFALPFPLASDWQVQIKISHPCSYREHEILIWRV